MEQILQSRPHTIKAIRINFPFTDVAPEWLLEAYKSGKVYSTYQPGKNLAYMTIVQGDTMSRGYPGQWLCLNERGKLFFLDNQEVFDNFVKLV